MQITENAQIYGRLSVVMILAGAALLVFGILLLIELYKGNGKIRLFGKEGKEPTPPKAQEENKSSPIQGLSFSSNGENLIPGECKTDELNDKKPITDELVEDEQLQETDLSDREGLTETLPLDMTQTLTKSPNEFQERLRSQETDEREIEESTSLLTNGKSRQIIQKKILITHDKKGEAK